MFPAEGESFPVWLSVCVGRKDVLRKPPLFILKAEWMYEEERVCVCVGWESQVERILSNSCLNSR